ncbi:MAG TPA: hypothetical protein ENK85_12460 [Saprospiraceae bacterium]|nr:hypothetical protein [Saprospiraceae bacterium]
MRLITLITDFGLKDYYASTLKGRLYSASLEIAFIDVTHQVAPFDITEAAFNLRNAWFHFPKGTIHIVNVVSGDEGQINWVAIQHEGHYFLLPDNGIFSLAFPEKKNITGFVLSSSENTPFAVLKDAVKYILDGRAFMEIGIPTNQLVERLSLQPVTGPGYLRGEVIHVDHYGNVITNITKELFDAVGQGRPCKVYFRKLDPIEQISSSYSDQPLGENVCLFNASGLLEVAINMGNAAELYGLEKDSSIQVDFYDDLKEQLEDI